VSYRDFHFVVWFLRENETFHRPLHCQIAKITSPCKSNSFRSITVILNQLIARISGNVRLVVIFVGFMDTAFLQVH